MHRILTGICCTLWCVCIAFAIGAQKQTVMDPFAAAQAFSLRLPPDTESLLWLSGLCETELSEEEIPAFLEQAAAELGLQMDGTVKKQQDQEDRIWELSGTENGTGCSLKYLRKRNGKNYISWRITDNGTNELEKRCSKMEQLREKYRIRGLVCMELCGTRNSSMTAEEMEEDAREWMDGMGISIAGMQEEGNLHLFYGYAESFGEGVSYDGKEVNVNLLYRTNGSQTRCILGFPTVQWDE